MGVTVIPTQLVQNPPMAEQLSQQSDLQTSPWANQFWNHQLHYEEALGEA